MTLPGYVTRELIEANIKMQSFEAGLKAITGTADGAQREMAFVTEEANRLGISIADAAQEYTRMVASAKGTVLAGQGVRDIFSATAEAARVLHLSTSQTSSAFLALQQMMSQGQIRAQDLKLQFAQVIPGALQIFARAAGVSTAKFNAMLQAGEVGLDILPKVAQELRNTFGAGLEDATQGSQANIERFKNAMFELEVQVSNGLLPAFTKLITYLGNEFVPGLAWTLDRLGLIKRTISSMSLGETTLEMNRAIQRMVQIGQQLDKLQAHSSGLIGGWLAKDKIPELEKEARQLAHEIAVYQTHIDALNKAQEKARGVAGKSSSIPLSPADEKAMQRMIDRNNKLMDDQARQRELLNEQLAERERQLTWRIKDEQDQRLQNTLEDLKSERQKLQEHYNKVLIILNHGLHNQMLTQSQYAQARAALEQQTADKLLSISEQQFQGMSDQGDKAFQKLESAVRGWGDTFTNTMADAVMQGKLSFTDLADSIIRDLLRIQIQQRITDPMVKWGTNFLNNLFPTPQLTSYTSLGDPMSVFAAAPGKASGGDVQAGRTYKVGEHGVELFRPSQNGQIVPNSQVASGVTINVINQTAASIETKSRRQPDGRKVVDMLIKDSVAKQVQQGAFDRLFRTTYGVARKGTPR